LEEREELTSHQRPEKLRRRKHNPSVEERDSKKALRMKGSQGHQVEALERRRRRRKEELDSLPSLSIHKGYLFLCQRLDTSR